MVIVYHISDGTSTKYGKEYTYQVRPHTVTVKPKRYYKTISYITADGKRKSKAVRWYPTKNKLAMKNAHIAKSLEEAESMVEDNRQQAKNLRRGRRRARRQAQAQAN